VAAAQAGRLEAEAALREILVKEDIPAWRATMISLLAPFAGNPATQTVLRSSLAATDPLERAAAVRSLTGVAPAEWLRPLLKDPVRLVRLDAAWALSPELGEGTSERRELDAYLDLSLDQPAGRVRLGEDLANRGQSEKALAEISLAAEWDPNSPGIFDSLGMVLLGLGRPVEAAERLGRAAELNASDGIAALRAGLAFNEAGNLPKAEAWFRQAVARNSRLDRAWYNLGLLLAQQDRLPESAQALLRAGALVENEPDYTYALATVLFRAGDATGARAAVEATLRLAPGHQEAKALLRRLP
jgi:tetratricopeptide (TPR) repeat protein